MSLKYHIVTYPDCLGNKSVASYVNGPTGCMDATSITGVVL